MTANELTTAQYLHGQWKKAVDKERAHRKILVHSICCEQWGFDSMRYEFTDGSMLVYCKITKAWDL